VSLFLKENIPIAVFLDCWANLHLVLVRWLFQRRQATCGGPSWATQIDAHRPTRGARLTHSREMYRQTDNSPNRQLHGSLRHCRFFLSSAVRTGAEDQANDLLPPIAREVLIINKQSPAQIQAIPVLLFLLCLHSTPPKNNGARTPEVHVHVHVQQNISQRKKSTRVCPFSSAIESIAVICMFRAW